MNVIKSKVMTIANRLARNGMSRRAAILKAWVIAKASALRVKVKGTSRRQSELEQLSEFKPSDISVTFRREPHNSYDSNAIAVYAVSSAHKVFFIGYLPKAVASVVAPLFDKGREPKAKAFNVTGGFNPWVSYGAALAIEV